MPSRLLALTVVLLAAPAFADDPAAPPKGFTALFNGKDLTGWQVYNGKADSWGVEKGLLVVSGGGGGWLMTKQQYANFELRLEFRLPKGANSGVALRAPLSGNPAFAGMEIQILDDPSYKDLKEWQHTGSVYAVVPASKIATRPLGQWNQYHITCNGRRVRVELNGETVVDADLDEYKAKAKANSGILRLKGHIGLQEHGGRVEFRNLHVKEL